MCRNLDSMDMSSVSKNWLEQFAKTQAGVRVGGWFTSLRDGAKKAKEAVNPTKPKFPEAAELMEAFQAFDLDGSGTIDASEVRQGR